MVCGTRDWFRRASTELVDQNVLLKNNTERFQIVQISCTFVAIVRAISESAGDEMVKCELSSVSY